MKRLAFALIAGLLIAVPARAYAQEHPQIAHVAKQDEISEWRWAQKRFEALKLHRKQRNGFNIWTCEVSGPRKSRRLHGYLLAEPRRIFVETPPNNPYLGMPGVSKYQSQQITVMVGTPQDSNGDGILGWLDNITNHNLTGS